MKGFKLNESGDLSIQNNIVQVIADDNLQCQTIKTVLNTNKGEWFLNANLGLDFGKMLGKQTINKAFYQNEIEKTIKQVDNSLTITSFECDYDNITRKLKINFTAKNDKNEIVEVTNTWA